MTPPTESEIELLRRMKPAEKLAVLETLIREAYQLKAAGLRATRPDLAEEEVRRRVRTSIGGG